MFLIVIVYVKKYYYFIFDVVKYIKIVIFKMIMKKNVFGVFEF